MNHKMGWAIFMAVVVSSLAFEPTWAAKKGWYLGGGFASQSVEGGFDGSTGYCSEGSCTMPPIVVPGKPDSGSGINILLGYQFNPNVGFEYLFSSTSHKATHIDRPEGESLTVSSGLIGLRLATGGEPLDLFMRLSLASNILTYADATWAGGNTWKEATFSGGGTGYGVGMAYQMDPWGLEFSYNVQNTELNTLTAGNITGEINPVAIKVTSLTGTMVYHFK